MTARAPRLMPLMPLMMPLMLLLLPLPLQVCAVPLAPLRGRGHLKDLPRGPVSAPHKKAPQFMLDLFNAVSREEGAPRSQKDILDGNIVRSFEDKGNSGERFHFFNLSSFGKDERMNKAEFRWFRKKQKLFMGKAQGPHFYKVDLYEVLDSRVKPWRGNLISTRLLPLYTQGWEVFNVTQVKAVTVQFSKDYIFVLDHAIEGFKGMI